MITCGYDFELDGVDSISSSSEFPTGFRNLRNGRLSDFDGETLFLGLISHH